MHRRFIEITNDEELKLRTDESPANFLARIHLTYSHFWESWRVSEHEPSKMVAFFVKISGIFLSMQGWGVKQRLLVVGSGKLRLDCSMESWW